MEFTCFWSLHGIADVAPQSTHGDAGQEFPQRELHLALLQLSNDVISVAVIAEVSPSEAP
jgi:hypothetical protein